MSRSSLMPVLFHYARAATACLSPTRRHGWSRSSIPLILTQKQRRINNVNTCCQKQAAAAAIDPHTQSRVLDAPEHVSAPRLSRKGPGARKREKNPQVQWTHYINLASCISRLIIRAEPFETIAEGESTGGTIKRRRGWAGHWQSCCSY